MDGLNLVVVGGGSGLGELLAEMAVSAGAAGIGIVDIDDAAGAAALAPAKAAGIAAAHAAADISTRQAAHDAVRSVTAELGRIDTLVNCAAIYPRRPLLEIDDDDWDASNAINIKGTFHTMTAAVELFRSQPRTGEVAGRVVNITSVDAFKAHPQNAHYAATKAAVVSLTRSFAHEFAPEGILVNSVAPAGMATDQAAASGFLDELAAASPLGRGGKPSEMAEWVLMAGGPKNTYMTGENIIVSGGYIYA